MQHLDEGTIHAWLDGALPAAEAADAAKHAAECASCAGAVAEARGIIAGSARIVSALDDVPGGVIPSRGGAASTAAKGASIWSRLHLTPGRAALAATILLAVSTTLTLRSSSTPQAKTDSIASVVRPSVAAATTPAPRVGAKPVTHDSLAEPARSMANAPRLPNPSLAARTEQAKAVAEPSQVADAVAPRDTGARDLAKPRVAAQEVAAGASASAPPAAPMMARGNLAQAKAFDQRADSIGVFEGCYRVSADSSSGSTELPRGLPTKFSLSRPSLEARAAVRRAFAGTTEADSSVAPRFWRQLSTTQASVTFPVVAGQAQPVSLVLTVGSTIGVASSGDRTTKVRVARAPCPP